MNTNIELTAKQAETGKIGLGLWVAFGICFLSSISAGLISTLMSAYLPVVVRTLSGNVSDDQLNNISAYISALYLLGWTIGGFAWGWISDQIGRGLSLILSVGCLGIFTIIISFAPSWEFVVAFRLLSGFAVGGVLVLTPTLLSEIWPLKSRSIMIGIDSIGFPVGIFSSGLVTYLVPAWRGGFYIGLLPLLIAVISIWTLKESENWKNAKADRSVARAIVREQRSNLIRGAVIFSSMLIGLWGMFSWIPTWVQSLLGGSDGRTERSVAMMLLGAGGLAGGFFSGWISNALGVRRSMMFCFSGCLLMSFLLFGLNTSFSKIIYVELALLSVFFGISQGLMSIYIPQLFPFQIRGRATGFCFNIGRFVTALAVFFVGVLVTALGGYSNTLMTFAGIFVAGFIAVYLTKDQTTTGS